MTDDKRRIDACLRACEGISTQNLEDNVPFLELARRYNVALRERDALHTALEKIADWDSAWGPYPETNEAWRAMVIVTAREAVPR